MLSGATQRSREESSPCFLLRRREVCFLLKVKNKQPPNSSLLFSNTQVKFQSFDDGELIRKELKFFIWFYFHLIYFISLLKCLIKVFKCVIKVFNCLIKVFKCLIKVLYILLFIKCVYINTIKNTNLNVRNLITFEWLNRFQRLKCYDTSTK